jgi:hypothetical protein
MQSSIAGLNLPPVRLSPPLASILFLEMVRQQVGFTDPPPGQGSFFVGRFFSRLCDEIDHRPGAK